MRNCIVAQSGGPTTAINASLAGILDQNLNSGYFDHVYGALNGITGVLNDRFLLLDEKIANETNFIENLKLTPAMYLGSCRYKLPYYKDDPDTYRLIFSCFAAYHIDTFFYIGGNDSMDTVYKLSQYASSIQSPVKIIGIPKTIDNDLCQIDHTPGFGSAAKYVASSILEIAHDTYIYGVKSITIVEIMGRDAGWLTAASALARTGSSMAPHLIYLPERAFSIEQCIEDTRQLLAKKNNILIAISEGIRDKDNHYISAATAKSDTFGHSQLSGAGKALELILKEALQVKTRSVELNVLQRCAAHLASLTDLNESMELGRHSVKLSMNGETAVMASLIRVSDQPYQFSLSSAPIFGVANGVKSVPLDFINKEGNDVTEKMLCYLRPLIIGEAPVRYTDGIPAYLDVSHLIH